MNLGFDLSAFNAEKNGTKTQTTTPIIEAKGALNRFGINYAALALMGITEEPANIVLLENTDPNVELGDRYVALIIKKENKDDEVPGARIIRKVEDVEKASGTFQYAPTWSKIQSNNLTVLSNEDMYMQKLLIKNGKNKYAGVKSVNFTVEELSKNVPVESFSAMPIFAEEEGYTVDVYKLSNPVDERYDARTLSGKKKEPTKVKEIDEIGASSENASDVDPIEEM